MVKKNNNLNKFLYSIHKEYVKARKTVKGPKSIIRGRSRNISGISEDLFAAFLYKELNKDVVMFVDQAITLVGKKKTIYPDVVICKKENKSLYKIFYMIDLKTDVGWHKRTFISHAKRLQVLANMMKSAKELKGKRGDIEDNKKTKLYFAISKKASYDEVIISSQNCGKEQHKIDMLNASHDKNMNLWVLSTGQHPNWYVKKNEMVPNDKDWNVLVKKIKSLI